MMTASSRRFLALAGALAFRALFCLSNFSGGKTDNRVWGTRPTHINRTRDLVIKKRKEDRLSIRPC